MGEREWAMRLTPARRALDDIGNRSNIVFVTVCTKDRRRLLASTRVHELLLHAWGRADAWMVGHYIILPDHIHLFCSPTRHDAPNVRDWTAYWKSISTRNWSDSASKPVWQREAWDRQLRKGDSYSDKWLYVRENPVRHGLVSTWEEWPYRGELNVLMWHD